MTPTRVSIAMTNEPHHELVARHYATGEYVSVRWADGRIVACSPAAAPVASARERYVAPALVDLQVNGYAGVDFQSDGLSEDDLITAARGLARDGCTRWFLTLITDDWPKLIARLGHLRRLRQASSELSHAIAGWHVEGPFLSAEAGFRGAHSATLMVDPSERHIAELRTAAGEDRVLLTLAPERPGSLACIRAAVAAGMIVSLGHTDAGAARLGEAAQAGAQAFTHLGNGCPRALDRHDNILWRVLDLPEKERLAIGLIPDAIHVSGPLFRLFHRLIDAGRIFYVSDAMAAAGAPPGTYRLGGLTLEVGADQVVRLPDQPNFAGSALRPIDGIRRAATMLGLPWARCWDHYCQVPARLVGMPAGLEAGAPGDLCLLELDSDGWPRIEQVWCRGIAGGSAHRPEKR